MPPARKTQDAKLVDPLAELENDEATPTPESIAEAPVAPTAPAKPVPEEQLTAEEREIRKLRHQLALAEGVKDPEVEYEEPADGETILIHFVANGFTALGQVWVTGQELEFEVGGRAYNDTKNSRGETWVSLAGDDRAQMKKWGKVIFRPGPWPGDPFDYDAAKAAGHTVNEAEIKRGRKAPTLPRI